MEQNKVYTKVRQLHNKGFDVNTIVDELNRDGFKNSKGGKITKSLINYVIYKKTKTSKKQAKSSISFNDFWVRTILKETNLKDDEKVRQLKAFLDL